MSGTGASSSWQQPPLVPLPDAASSSSAGPRLVPFQHRPDHPSRPDGNDQEQILKEMPWPPKWWPDRKLQSKRPRVMVAEQNALGKIKTGMRKLDTDLGGGIAIGSVTEVYGQAGCGKSQFCLQLVCDVLLEKKRRPEIFNKFAVYYVATEGHFPLNRIVEMLQPHTENREEIARLLQFLVIEKVSTPSELWNVLANKLPVIAARYTMKLFIVDSIASVFRVLEQDPNGGPAVSMSDRALQMFRVSMVFKRIASQYNSAVVCVNQVSQVVKDHGFGGNAIKPALGLAWDHCINTRISLWRADRPHTAVRKRYVPREEWQIPCQRQNYDLTSPILYSVPVNGYFPDVDVSVHDESLVPTNTHNRGRLIHRSWKIEFAPNSPFRTGSFFIESQGLVEQPS
eukprot:gene1226-746_t